MLEEKLEEAHQHSPTSIGQLGHFGCAHPESLTEAEVCSQGSFGQPDQAMELKHASEEDNQDSIQECDQTLHSPSDCAEAIEHSQVADADATHQGPALSHVRMATEVQPPTYHAA